MNNKVAFKAAPQNGLHRWTLTTALVPDSFYPRAHTSQAEAYP
jgi:hypothetical protein